MPKRNNEKIDWIENLKCTKYNNKKTEIDGIKFDSKKESQRYCELKLLEKANIIHSLILQPKFILQEKFKKNGKSYQEIKYIADFQYFCNERQKLVVEDVKGFETTEFKLKRKMFEFMFRDLELTLIK